MGPDLQKAIHDLSLRMRLLRAIQEDDSATLNLTEREEMIVYLLAERGEMTVSQIASAAPNVSFSTVSTTITKLWRDKKLVSKSISPDSQRVTIVDLTDKGHDIMDQLREKETIRYKTLIRALEVTDEEKMILLRMLTRANTFFDKYLGLEKELREKTV